MRVTPLLALRAAVVTATAPLRWYLREQVPTTATPPYGLWDVVLDTPAELPAFRAEAVDVTEELSLFASGTPTTTPIEAAYAQYAALVAAVDRKRLTLGVDATGQAILTRKVLVRLVGCLVDPDVNNLAFARVRLDASVGRAR